jgi:hypothetical protein
MIRKLYNFCNRNWWQINTVLLLLILALILLTMVGCVSDTRTGVKIEKRTVTISRTVQQILAPNGDIVKLESVTKTVTDENGQQIGSEEVTVRPPEVVGKLASLVGAGIGIATGVPAAGAAAEKAVDWLTTLVTGGTLAATTAGTGYVAMKRKTATDDARRRADELERQRNELIDGVERAKSTLEPNAWATLTTHLECEQSADTKAAVAKRTE